MLSQPSGKVNVTGMSPKDPVALSDPLVIVVASTVVAVSGGAVADPVGSRVLAAVGSSVVPEEQAAIVMAATVAVATARMACLVGRPGRTDGVGSTVMMSPPREPTRRAASSGDRIVNGVVPRIVGVVATRWAEVPPIFRSVLDWWSGPVPAVTRSGWS
jgi:hypothetical protein